MMVCGLEELRVPATTETCGMSRCPALKLHHNSRGRTGPPESAPIACFRLLLEMKLSKLQDVSVGDVADNRPRVVRDLG